MTKKDFECQVHTWMMKKAKSRVYKGDLYKKKKGEKKKKKRRRSGGSEETYGYTLHSDL